MPSSVLKVAVGGLACVSGLTINAPPVRSTHSRAAVPVMAQDIERKTGDNVEQIKDTKRDKVMTCKPREATRSGTPAVAHAPVCTLHRPPAPITSSQSDRPV